MKICTVLFLILLSFATFAQNGTIKGKVVEAANNQSVPFANIVIVGTTTGVSSDLDGNYEITGLEPGTYDVSVSFLGFKTLTESEVMVTNSKPTIIDFKMEEDVENTPEVVVTASPFKKTSESPVSLQTIGTTEIQRNPGGARDISRVVRVLPGVTSTASFRNDLLIRGGAPNENRFYLDDIEVPNINHFATQGSSGGPNGLINVDFIREVDFFSGAFPANRGNTLSSVFNFKQKSGRDDRIGFTATVGTSDVGLTLEGPIGKKTTFIVSARQSYLQLLFDVIGLPFLPTYNDFQFKIRTRFDEKNEFYVTGLGAIDRFKLNLDANETAEQRYLLDNLPVNNQWNYTLGAAYKHFGENGFWTFVASRNMLNNDVFKHVDNDENNERYIDYTSQEIENKIRVENTTRFKGFKLSSGVGYQYVRYTNKTKSFQFVNGLIEPVTFESELGFHKYSIFAQLSRSFFADRLTLSTGARLDGNSYSKEMANPLPQVSPRFSASFDVTPRFSVNFNTGWYHQLPAYTAMGYRENGELVNKDRLKYLQNLHFVGGVAYNTDFKMKISLEGYYKLYKNYPFLINEQLSLANLGSDFGIIGNAPIESTGEGRTYGMEVLIQQRSFKGFYGILAYTLGWTEFKDAKGEYAPSSWDSRHIINLAAGKSFNIVNKSLREQQNTKRAEMGKAPIKGKMIPQTLDVGMNFRFQTGLPYTPFDEPASALTQNWNRIGQGIRDYTLLNTERAKAFYGVDFRVDYKWFFEKWSFNLYVDLQNIPGVATGTPNLILDQGESGDDPVQINNPGQPNESYRLRRLEPGLGTIIPTLGIVVQY